MLTPQEVSGKSFPKSSFGSGGYHMASVDEFLDTLTEDYTSLYKENATLKTKLKVLAEKIEEYRATEDAMRSTLLTAQRMAAKLVQDAEAEKEQILRKMQEDAAERKAQLDEQTRQAEERLELGRRNLSDFIAHSRELCDRQVAFLNSLPDIPVAEPETPFAPEAEHEPAAEEPAAPEEQAEEQAEEHAQEHGEESPQAEEHTEPDPMTDDTAVYPRDFKMNLDQLKFGRNYQQDKN